ncbi:hypothetical protein ABIA96_007370 [Bradyrhizobium sp. LB11.1]
MAAERAAWKASQPEIGIHRLVFIDETGASTKMARRYGRSPYGQRCVAALPHGHWKTTTFVGALRATGMTAPYSPDLNPIEMAFAKLKAALRKAAARSIEALDNAIALALAASTAQECLNFFAAAGYDRI